LKSCRNSTPHSLTRWASTAEKSRLAENSGDSEMVRHSLSRRCSGSTHRLNLPSTSLDLLREIDSVSPSLRERLSAVGQAGYLELGEFKHLE
jgi:hypothetical protein